MFEPGITDFCRQLRKNQTPSEVRLWKALKHNRFAGYKFRRQHPVFYQSTEGKKRFFVPDFYCTEKNLVIELDGKIHEFQKDYDDNRDMVLSQLGLKTIRILNGELERSIGAVASKILMELKAR